MTQFSDLSLDPRVLQAVLESGYTVPTPIQAQAIPHALEGRDVLGIAQTGTGKTAGFVLPMLTHLSKGRARARMPRSLVLAPTRELAAQVAEQFEKYSAHLKLSMALLIGGVSFKDQDKLIDRGVDVLIATPGRLLDHFERGKLMLTGVQIMVVDEADRMLDMGFIPDIERIFKLVPFTRQTLFFSATMAPEITRITDTFLHNPVRVEVARQATTSETIEQWVVKHAPKRKDTAEREKREVLRRLILSEGDALTNGIIFCNRKRDVDIVAKSLKRHGFDAEAMHGDLDQKLRMKILQAFRDGELKLLIASDVAARGLDIPNVSHIFNFDVPIHSEDYVHRIGRTGRAGRWGKSFTLCLPGDEKYLGKIEELVKQAVPVMPSPLGSEEELPERRAASDRRRGERDRGEREAGERAGTERERPERRRERRSERPRPAETPAPVVAAAPEETKAPAAEPRRGRDRGGRSEPGVVGMGDHVPAFLLRELRIDEYEAEAEETAAPLVEPAVSEALETAPAAAETAPEAHAEHVAETLVPAEPVADAEPAAAELVAAEPVAEAAAEEAAPAPKRAPRGRTRAKAALAEAPAA